MTEYIATDDVRKRLTTVGLEYVADRDMSGSGITSQEEADYITPAIQWAGAVVDGAIVEFVEVTMARAANNQWLKDRCLDLAVCRALQVGAREVPDAITEQYKFAMLLLYGGTSPDGLDIRGVQQSQRVPGLMVPRPSSGQQVRFPRVRRLL